MYNDLGVGSKREKWWNIEKERAHEDIHRLVRFIDGEQQYRTMQNLRNVRLYGDLDIIGTSPFLFAHAAPSTRVFRTSWNVVKSCCDTLAAKIAKNKVKPTFLTSGGDWELQQKAKKLDKALQGMFYSGKVYEIMPRMFLDACIFGTGIVKVYSEGTEVCYERVFAEEIKVDDLDGFYGTPRNMYQCRYVDRNTLLDLYPEHQYAITQAAAIADTGSYVSDMVLLIEAFHLPSSEGGDDGRHVLCLETCTLVDQPWKRQEFPFVFYHWSQLPYGFWGRSVADELAGIQLEISKTLINIQQAIGLMSAPKVLIENGSKIAQGKLDNQTGAIWRYSGIKPEIVAPQPIANQVFQWVEALYDKAFELIGISGTTAQGTKPSYELSGKAVREYNDIESERFVQQSVRYEDAFMRLADLSIKEAKKIAAKNPGWELKTFNKKNGLEFIKWSEIDLDKDKYVMQRFPTAYLAQTPALRVQQVQELVQAGYIGPDQAVDMLDFPDIEEWADIKYSPRRLIEKILSGLMDGKEYVTPEPFLDLMLARTLSHLYYLKSQVDGMPQDIQDNLRRFTEDVQDLIDKAQQPAAPAAAPQTGMPGAVPQTQGQQGTQPMPQGALQPQIANAPSPEFRGIVAPSLQR